MVFTRSSKTKAECTTTPSGGRASSSVDSGRMGTGAARGAAFTMPQDVERMRDFRAAYLSKRRTWRDRVSTFVAQVEVHSGAYMFDVREHVLFYSLFGVIVFLVAKSVFKLLTCLQ